MPYKDGKKNIFIGYDAGRMAVFGIGENIGMGDRAGFYTSEDRRDRFSVNTYVEGDYIVVSSEGFRREIKRKDSWWDKFRGITWESKVRKAQKDAFMEAYKINMIK